MKKKILAAIFAVLLILSLASCAGIGDGALMKGEPKQTEEATRSDIIGIGTDPNGMPCEVTYGSAVYSLADGQMLYYALITGNYETDVERTTNIKQSITVSFPTANKTFTVEDDDWVVDSGRLSGIFGRIITELHSAEVKSDSNCEGEYLYTAIFMSSIPQPKTMDGSSAIAARNLLLGLKYEEVNKEEDTSYAEWIAFTFASENEKRRFLIYPDDTVAEKVYVSPSIYSSSVMEKIEYLGKYDGIYEIFKEMFG